MNVADIERVFLATLPQYLEPVEHMIDQLFAGGASDDGDRWQALAATLSSLRAAASRIGATHVAVGLDRMAALADRAAGGMTAGELRQQLLAELNRVRRVAGAQFDRSRRGQVELEAGIEELRGEVARLRARAIALSAQLDEAPA